MERKIGEIFIYKGKTYQVVKSDICMDCVFRERVCSLLKSHIGPCTSNIRSDKTSVIFKEIDTKNSDLVNGIIKLKKKDVTYKAIEDALNLEENRTSVAADINNVTKLSAIDRLINIARYYNGGWKPDWSNIREYKYHIMYNNNEDTYAVDFNNTYTLNSIYFKNKEDAISVISNINFKDILDTIYKN